MCGLTNGSRHLKKIYLAFCERFVWGKIQEF